MLLALLVLGSAAAAAADTPACDAAIGALNTFFNVTEECYTQQGEGSPLSPLCQLFFEAPPSPTTPNTDLLPVLTGPYPGFAAVGLDTTFGASMVQSLFTNGVMSQAGDIGETTYVIAGIDAAWKKVVNASQVTQDSILKPWEDGFYALADRLVAKAENRSNGWDDRSRSSALLRAGAYYFTGQWRFPTSDSSLQAMKNCSAAFQKGIKLGYKDSAVLSNAPYTVNGVEHKLPVTFMRPMLPAGQKVPRKGLPLLLFTTGLDFPSYLMWAWYAPGALARGYAVAFFDGPGQGLPLNEQGLEFTPQWDKVAGAVLDSLQAHDKKGKLGVKLDFKRTALVGYSTGGWLGTAACKGLSHCLKACVVSPALTDLSAIFLDPTASAIFSPMTYIAQQAPQLLPGNTSTLYLDASDSILRPLVGECSLEGPAPGMFNALFDYSGNPLPDYDLLYLIYAFTGLRNSTGAGMLANVWASYRAVLAFNATLTAGSSVPTLVLTGTEDATEGTQNEAYLASLTPAARKKSKLVVYNAPTGGAQHCQNGAMLAQEADIYAWLKTAL